MEANVLFFGGSFNPIHNGHLIMARIIKEELNALQTVFIPNGISPNKKEEISADSKLEMVALAVHGETDFFYDGHEVKKETPSYTLETIKYIQETYNIKKPKWLIGPDNLEDLKKWHKPDELVEECTFVIGGPKELGYQLTCGIHPSKWYSLPQFKDFPFYSKMEIITVVIPTIEIRSTIIRERMKKGLSIRNMVPDEVEKYIRANGLYL